MLYNGSSNQCCIFLKDKLQTIYIEGNSTLHLQQYGKKAEAL